MADPPVLDISNLAIDFRTREGLVRAVDDVSFGVAAGEIVGLVGESGSGKTISMLGLGRPDQRPERRRLRLDPVQGPRTDRAIAARAALRARP